MNMSSRVKLLIRILDKRSIKPMCINSKTISNAADEPIVPTYNIRRDETIEIKRARLLYQSRKRGMLENGLILSTFANKYLNSFTEKQLNLYDELINLPSNDWDIYYWATGTNETPIEFQHEVFDLLKKHVMNEGRELRNQQPDIDKTSYKAS